MPPPPLRTSSVSASTSCRRGEGEEGFVGRGAVRQIGLEHALDGPRRVLRLDVAVDLARQRGVRPEAAADQDVIALDGVAVLGGRHLAGDQADVADVMLRAGMMAAGEMDVDRAVELDTRLAPCARSPRRAAWCRRRRSGSRHCRCRRRGRRGSSVALVDRPSASIAASASSSLSSGTPEISRFCQTVRRISPSPSRCGDRRRARASAPAVSLPTGSTTPIQFRPACFCGCTPICAARSNAGRGAIASGGTRVELARRASPRSARGISRSPGVEHVFQPRLVAVGAVAMVDEHAHDARRPPWSRRPA